jgi:hypothetical protein
MAGIVKEVMPGASTTPGIRPPLVMAGAVCKTGAVPDKDAQGEVRYFAELEVEVHRADGRIEQLGVVAKREVPAEQIPQEWLRAIGAIP